MLNFGFITTYKPAFSLKFYFITQVICYSVRNNKSSGNKQLF